MNQLAASAHPSCHWISQSPSHVIKLKKNSDTSSNNADTMFDPFIHGNQQTWSAGIVNSHTSELESAVRKSTGSVDNAQMIREQYLNSIRLFGYKYLLPLGISRTMQAMVEEEEAMEADDNNEVTGNPLDMSNPPIDRNEEIPSAFEETNEPSEDWNQQPPGIEDSSTAEEGVSLDLDADIPDASDNDYDNAYDDYDEDQYQEAFMTEDEYDLPSEDQSRLHSETENEQRINGSGINRSNSLSVGEIENAGVGDTEEHAHPSFIVHSSIDLSHSLLVDPDGSEDEDMSIGL